MNGRTVSAVAEVPSNEPTLRALQRARQNGGVRLKDHEHAVAQGISPFMGEAPVLPDKINPAIPDNIWASLQISGALAATHLQLILSDKRFPKLSVRDQSRLIELALGRAYGSVDGAVRKNLHVFVNPEDAKGFNALADMSRKATRRLPEFKTSVSPLEGKLSDEDGSD